MRYISYHDYDIEGPDGEGCEYGFVNVKNGVSRLEQGGSSLQNWANADAIISAMDKCVSHGIPATDINVLTLYLGQKKLVLTKIREKVSSSMENVSQEEAERKWAIGDVCTVDSFQGRQAPIVFLDIVAASDKATQSAEEAQDMKDTATDPYEGSHTYGNVTSFVRSPNRLCVAITRPQYGLIIFGNKSSLIGSVKPPWGDIRHSLALLVLDAMDRKLVSDDNQHLDTHPEGIKQRKQWEEQAKRNQEASAKANSLAFVSKLEQQQHNKGKSAANPTDGDASSSRQPRGRQHVKKAAQKGHKKEKKAEGKAAEEKANADKTTPHIPHLTATSKIRDLSRNLLILNGAWVMKATLMALGRLKRSGNGNL